MDAIRQCLFFMDRHRGHTAPYHGRLDAEHYARIANNVRSVLDLTGRYQVIGNVVDTATLSIRRFLFSLYHNQDFLKCKVLVRADKVLQSAQ